VLYWLAVMLIITQVRRLISARDQMRSLHFQIENEMSRARVYSTLGMAPRRARRTEIRD
ncbi:hypothetical protein KIPB_010882, partial [Kipferlia bialata]